jgi:carbon starvation protein
LGEGVLALIATLAVSAGLADWASHYHGFAAAKGGGVGAFVNGSATFLMAWGIPGGAAKVVVSVLVVSFAATSLDTGIRIQRFILEELGRIYGIKGLQNRMVAAAVAVGLPLILYLAGQQRFLWPLFGGGNQLLAGVSLLVITLWLWRNGKAWWVTGVPMIIVLMVSALALISLVGTFLSTGRYVLGVVGTLMVALEIWIFLEGLAAWRRERAKPKT